MVNLDWKSNPRMAAPDITTRSSALSSEKPPHLPRPSNSPRGDDDEHVSIATAAYEHYLHLSDLSKCWLSRDFPAWNNEPITKPALQALEITFRFIALALSNPRPYSNRRLWKRRLQSLAMHQIDLIATVCEDEEQDGSGGAPIAKLGSSSGILTRERRTQSQEVWKIPGEAPVVSRTSGGSLLPRLAAWEKSEDVASKIRLHIESQMQGCPFTLGLGEPNLAGKPNLEYDLVVNPAELRSLKIKKPPPLSSYDAKNNPEEQQHDKEIVLSIHQIVESWVFAAREVLKRAAARMEKKEWAKAASDCWLLERIWNFLSEAEDLHLLMDPDDFLRLKAQLGIRSANGSESLCLRSAGMRELTRSCKDLRQLVPWILGVEVDPRGGPRLQDAAMKLYHRQSKRRVEDEEEGVAARIQLLQALQAIEAAVKSFFFRYRQLISSVMGSSEAGGTADSWAQLFLEPPYFPSLDGAKSFVGDFWHRKARLA